MKYFGEGLSEQHKKLQHMIRKEQELEAAKELFLSFMRHCMRPRFPKRPAMRWMLFYRIYRNMSMQLCRQGSGNNCLGYLAYRTH